MIKEAAKRLLDKGEISQDEYAQLEKLAAALKFSPIFGNQVADAASAFSPIFGGATASSAASTFSPIFGNQVAAAAKSGIGAQILSGLLKNLGPAAIAAGVGAAAAASLKKPVGNIAAAAAKRASGLIPGLQNIMFPQKSMLQQIVEQVKPVAFTAGALGGVALVGKELAGQIGTQVGIGNSFNQMQEKVPQLQQYDKEDMRDYFNVVKTYSPKAASNPLVAGALVHKMMMMGGVDHKLVQDISQIETKPRSGLVFDIAATTAKSLAGMPTFGASGSSGSSGESHKVES